MDSVRKKVFEKKGPRGYIVQRIIKRGTLNLIVPMRKVFSIVLSSPLFPATRSPQPL